MKHGLLKKLVPVTLSLLLGICATAQEESSNPVKVVPQKPSFHVIATAGLLAGSNGRDLQVQAIPNLKSKDWSFGMGGGLDYYYLRSIPLFVDVRKHFTNYMPLFLYGDIGLNVPWVDIPKQQLLWMNQSFKTDLYFDLGAGWQVHLNNRNNINFSAGYTGKKLREFRKSDFQDTKLTYDLRRISVKVGFQF
jgi:hypothetical protein